MKKIRLEGINLGCPKRSQFPNACRQPSKSFQNQRRVLCSNLVTKLVFFMLKPQKWISVLTALNVIIQIPRNILRVPLHES